MKNKELINQLEEFIDKIGNEWTLIEVEIKITPKYGDKLTLKKELSKE